MGYLVDAAVTFQFGTDRESKTFHRESLQQFATGIPRQGAGPTEMETEPLLLRCAVVGRGRMGTALAARLREAGTRVDGPLGRDPDVRGADIVLLAVPDGEIAAAAATIAPGPLVGHLSGATTLAPLAPHEAFSLHPLMTVTG